MAHKKIIPLVYAADFETTVYDGQKDTEVWASVLVALNHDRAIVYHNIDDLMEYFFDGKHDYLVYFHNLKFDGAFILQYLFKSPLKHGVQGEYPYYNMPAAWDMEDNSFTYSISSDGMWYRIMVKHKGKYIEFRDSLKLMPFTLAKIGKGFKTKHKKLEMVYEGNRFAGCEITDEERQYIENDAYVLKEGLEFMYSQNHTSMTIGSCCLDEYKKIVKESKVNWDTRFPDIYKECILQENMFGTSNAGEYIRKSYRGGWCYVVPGKTNRVVHNGTTADVNSLYPSMMHSMSGNRYPIGLPCFWYGNYIPEEAKSEKNFYFIRFRCRFKIKPGKLPFIQIKSNLLYSATEMLETSDILSKRDGRYYSYYLDVDGNRVEAIPEMTMTMMDWVLFNEHYDITDLTILDGCYFYSMVGIFDEYINRYAKIKMTSEGAMRELAKLFLNNLYGKMASSTDSSFKVARIDENGVLRFVTINESEKKPGYIPVGSAITSYARCFTIRAAQKNFHGADKPGFIYADTDSIHCDIPADQVVGIKVHPTDFCAWKLESSWDIGYFVRPKTYIEHVVCEDLKPIEKPHYNIKCAGMPEVPKKLFEYAVTGWNEEDEEFQKFYRKIPKSCQDWLYPDGKHRSMTLNDFKVGLSIPGKLKPEQIPGGVLLVSINFTMLERAWIK